MSLFPCNAFPIIFPFDQLGSNVFYFIEGVPFSFTRPMLVFLLHYGQKSVRVSMCKRAQITYQAFTLISIVLCDGGEGSFTTKKKKLTGKIKSNSKEFDKTILKS